ncbi:MAG: tryptophan-rich sensory protein [Alphaproteobacteria bacterium]|nr:tryptophan-rich sensory protein [Alphaproteobacteria bacterium]
MKTAQRADRRHDLLGLVAFVAICALVSGIGGAFTASSVGTWYQTLSKPAFNPPDWLFGPVWTTLYLMIAVAGWRVWRRRQAVAVGPALTAYAVQLGLNLGWSFLFFFLRAIGAALVDVVALLLAIAINAALFWRVDRWAGALLLPYLLWVAFATVLNAALWRLN